MTVPPELGLKCQACGYDLTGLDERICPKCKTPFRLPIPEELDLHCRECNYNLTGLTTRICPECGSIFDVRGLLFARNVHRRYPLRDIIPWQSLTESIVGFPLLALGIVLIARQFPLATWAVIGLTALMIGRAYTRGTELSKVVFLAGVTWTIIGGLFTLIF